jgi:hypothetical protein
MICRWNRCRCEANSEPYFVNGGYREVYFCDIHLEDFNQVLNNANPFNIMDIVESFENDQR